MAIGKISCVICGAAGYMQSGAICNVCDGKGYINAPEDVYVDTPHDEFEKKLIETLEETNKRCHEGFDRAKGVRGSTNNPSCNFYMGAYAMVRDVIDAIETRKTTKLEQWGK